MHVARPQADPVHRGQVADRVGDVRVLDQLGLRRGARREVEQQRVVARGRAVGRELGRAPRRCRRSRSQPSTAPPTAIRVQSPGTASNLPRVRGRDDDVARTAALDPVDQVVAAAAASSPG